METYTDSALTDRAKEFLTMFKEDSQYKYVDQIDAMPARNEVAMVLDYIDLIDDDVLEREFSRDPDRMLRAISRAIKETLQTRFPGYAQEFADDITVRMTNYPLKNTVREINSHSSGKFITIRAMLIRMSPAESIPYVATYRCPDMHRTVFRARGNHSISVPVVCSDKNCRQRTFELDPKESKFVDYQILQLQELPKDLPAGKLPKTLGVFVAGSLVDSARLGDVVEISGIVRPELSRELKLGIPIQTYRHRLYANNIEQVSNEFDLGEITEKDAAEIEAFVRSAPEDAMTASLAESFAPHIRGHGLLKEALVLTMIGSDSHTLQDGKSVRGDINMLLVGDPGTGKSELGKAVYRVAPRAFYTSGRGSSGVGLTAATIKDPVTGVYMLEPGTTVLADRGLAVIDEFDKMRPEDRSALHEVMEQQSASIAKGGINVTLNARASIVAIANPVYGKYDPYKNLTENIPSIPIPLLTRFDLIFVVRDVPEKERDRSIAGHIMSQHEGRASSCAMDSLKFAKYLRVAKKIRPRLAPAAQAKIIDYYLRMRDADSGESGFTVTPRQLEGLIRLAMSRAKMLLKETADESDADRAIWLIEEMLKSSGVDVDTGKVDLGVLQGRPQSEIDRLRLFQDIMKSLVSDGIGVTLREIQDEMAKSSKWDEASAEKFVKRIIAENMIYESSPGRYRSIS